jgi:hypothetical protein
MKGLRIRLLQGDKIFEETELRDLRPGTEVKLSIGSTSDSQKFDSTFSDVYQNVLNSYITKLMSNEELTLSVNCFLYD